VLAAKMQEPMLKTYLPLSRNIVKFINFTLRVLKYLMKNFLEPEKAIRYIFSTRYLADELNID
jgi:hypothetical protein